MLLIIKEKQNGNVFFLKGSYRILPLLARNMHHDSSNELTGPGTSKHKLVCVYIPP